MSLVDMNDRELIELAANAAGLEVWSKDLPGSAATMVTAGLYTSIGHWNPLADDGDALRLAVKLALGVEPYTGVKMGSDELSAVANITDVYSLHNDNVALSERHNVDPNAATRRAIVRAAAEIGRMQTNPQR